MNTFTIDKASWLQVLNALDGLIVVNKDLSTQLCEAELKIIALNGRLEKVEERLGKMWTRAGEDVVHEKYSYKKS